MSDAPLYERDPAAWQAYLAEGNRTQPRKRVAADVLVRDEVGRILLVHPRYKPDWDLPGGMVEANEPPRDAASREVYEELRIRLAPGRLLVIDWVGPHGPWDDLLAFVFDGGVLDAGQLGRNRLDNGELAAFAVLPPRRGRPAAAPLRALARRSRAVGARQRHESLPAQRESRLSRPRVPS